MSDCRFGDSPVNYPDPDPDPVPPSVEKLRVNIFLIQFELLYKIFRQILRRNECKYKQLQERFINLILMQFFS